MITLSSFYCFTIFRFQLKAQRETGGDDTALGSIRLICKHGNFSVESLPANRNKTEDGVTVVLNYDVFGTFGDVFQCPGYYTGARFRLGQ
jgi:hypothetical protein